MLPDQSINMFLADWFGGLPVNILWTSRLLLIEIFVQTAIFPDYTWLKYKLFLSLLKPHSTCILFLLLVRKLWQCNQRMQPWLCFMVPVIAFYLSAHFNFWFLVCIFCLIWGGESPASFFNCKYSDVQIYVTFTFFSWIFDLFFLYIYIHIYIETKQKFTNFTNLTLHPTHIGIEEIWHHATNTNSNKRV